MLEKKRIKILQGIRQGNIGGGESHLLSLVENLDRSRFESVVLSFTDGPMIKRLSELGVETTIIHTTRPFDFSKWNMVKKILKEQRIDMVHAHGTRANSNILWAARSLGIPVIYTVHGWSFHPDQNWLVRNIRVMGEKYLTARTDKNISVSLSNQQSGKKFIKEFDSVVINNGIDQHKFDPNREYKDIRAELGIAKDIKLVLFIARFTAHKQPIALINAFIKALGENPGMHLLMVGEGDQKEEAITLINTLRAEEKAKITLQSFRQDVPDVLAAADIFVLPSLWEGLPIGLLEAMAMGKTVIATNVDGTSEIIRHDDNGWLVETHNLVPDLATALHVLSQDEVRAKRYQHKAITTINERYSADTMTRRIENVYTEVINGKKPK